ncbi:MAG: MgtC/SapB family protein [Planctomycetes bacterium]|nr:MgtC/SapB family protein [Planctomycetota bacterium]
MEPVAEDLYRFGVALAIGALIGLERQFSGTHDDADDGAERAPLLPPPSGEELRAAVAAGAAPPPASPPPRPIATPAGVRTYALLAVTGGAAAYLGTTVPWLLPAALLVVGALVLAGYLRDAARTGDLGLTSEVSAIITFLLGGIAVAGHTTVAAACAVAVTTILALKRRLHEFTWRLEQADIRAVLKFAVISVVVLPLLPAEPIAMGDIAARREAARADVEQDGAPDGAPPEEAPAPDRAAPDTAPSGAPRARPWWHEVELAPRKVWYLVVLISAVSFCGYVLSKVLGPGRGLVVTGAVGGLVSSTAVSLSFAQRSREAPDLAPRLAMGVLLANAIMPLRLLLLVAVVDLAVALRLLLPLGAMALAGGACALWLHLRRRGEPGTGDVQLRNPFEITPALKFGAVFAAVLVLSQVAAARFGSAGTYALAVLSGVTDVDAIGLALSSQVGGGRLALVTGVVGIVLAAISNTVVKGGLVAWFGAPRLRRITLVSFGLMLAAAVGGVAALQAL